MRRILAPEEDVVGVTLLDDSSVQLYAMEPVCEEEDFLVAECLGEEGVIATLAAIAITQDDQRARVLAADLIQGRVEIQGLFSGWHWMVPLDAEPLLACRLPLHADGYTATSTPGTSTAATTWGADRSSACRTASRPDRAGTASASLECCVDGCTHEEERGRQGTHKSHVLEHRSNLGNGELSAKRGMAWLREARRLALSPTSLPSYLSSPMFGVTQAANEDAVTEAYRPWRGLEWIGSRVACPFA